MLSCRDCTNTFPEAVYVKPLLDFVVEGTWEKKGGTYIFDSTAGFDIVVEGHPLLVVGVLPWAEDVLETLVVGFLIDDPHAALHSDGAAAVEVCVQVSAVAAAVVAATLEFLLLKKCDLWKTYTFNKPMRRKSL